MRSRRLKQVLVFALARILKVGSDIAQVDICNPRDAIRKVRQYLGSQWVKAQTLLAVLKSQLSSAL